MLVLCNFIGGLGAGALSSQRLTRGITRLLRLKDRLRLYGFIELLVTAGVLLTIVAKNIPTDIWGPFPYQLQNGIFFPSLEFELFQLVTAIICVFVPCYFMGVTFPLLCHTFAKHDRFPSTLYGWNTLGACSGVLACHFLFLPLLGYDLMFLSLAAANGLLGAFFLLTGETYKTTLSPGLPRVQKSHSNDPSDEILKDTPKLGVLITCAVLGGLLSGAVEGNMLKRIGILTGPFPSAMSFISFWAILGIFLASFTVRIVPWLRLFHIKVAFVVALVVDILIWNSAYPIRIWLENRVYQEALAQITDGRFELVTQLGLATMLLVVGAFLFPVYFLISLLLPYICNRFQSSYTHLGIAYGANTLAFCLGMVGFTWIFPRVNMFYSMKLATVLFGIGILLLLSISEKKRLVMWKPIIAGIAFTVGCIYTSAEFDRSYVNPMDWAAEHPVRALKSNGAHTTYVVNKEGVDILFFDDHRMSSNGPESQTYMRLMAHFPLLLQSNPKRALLIGFGVGNTAAAIAAHKNVRQINIVELNHKIIETAPEFSKTNNQVYLDPRVRFINDDGRNYLSVSDQNYDLITSEPPPPMHTGVYRLYSKEYYQQVLSHLTPDGLMTQWLPIHQMPKQAVDVIVSTFIKVFPYTFLFSGWGTDYILVGGASPIELERIPKRFRQSRQVLNDLQKIGVTNPIALLGRIVKGDAALRSQYGDKAILSDQHNDLEYLVLDALNPAVITYNPADVLSEIRSPELQQNLRGIVKHLGRLRYHVDSFPTQSLMASPPKGIKGLRMADVDWYKIDQGYRECATLITQQRYQEAREKLEKLLTMGEELPRTLIWLSLLHRKTGQFQKAISVLEKFVHLEPHEALGYFDLGRSRIRLGEVSAAIENFRKAFKLDPGTLPKLYQFAWDLAVNPSPRERAPDKAIALAQHLLKENWSHQARTLDILAAAFASSGDLDRAIRTAEKSLRLARKENNKTLQVGVRTRLESYKRSLSRVGSIHNP